VGGPEIDPRWVSFTGTVSRRCIMSMYAASTAFFSGRSAACFAPSRSFSFWCFWFAFTNPQTFELFETTTVT
jgi:hypothetical protein